MAGQVSQSHKEPMGMSEETSDTGMKGKKKDKNEEERGKKERIVTLTLEMIYLLTGEHYIPRKKSDDGGALHAPGSVIQKENNKNDKKILELMSNIIQLLTGEEWDVSKGKKYLYKKGIKKNSRQLRPLDCEYEDKRDITADLGGTICYNNETSKIGAEGADFCTDGNLTNSDISPAEQPFPANGIKEKASSCEEGNQSDCSINSLTEEIQGTDTPTLDMQDCNNDSLEEDYLSVIIKNEPDSWDEENQSDCSINSFTEQRADTPINSNLLGIKDNLASIDGGNHSASSMNTSLVERQGTSTSGALHPDIPLLTGLYPCAECDQHFMTKGGLVRHRKTHAATKQFNCSVCEKSFAREAELVVHNRSHTGEKPFSCPECGKCFSRLSYLNRHQGIHSGEKPFPCSQCGKQFRYLSELSVHCRSHTGERPFSCNECGKQFKHQSNLIIHNRLHTGERPFMCTECGNDFKDRKSLTVHKRIHTGEKPFTCSHCGKSFAHRSYFNRHLILHADEKAFTCPHCDKHFTSRSHLHVHLRVHTGEKPYSCSECGKCFTHHSHLTVHYRTHTGEKPFPCLDCGRRFKDRSNLRVHRRTHTGERPFSCTECGRCFTRRSLLTAHFQFHVREREYLENEFLLAMSEKSDNVSADNS